MSPPDLVDGPGTRRYSRPPRSIRRGLLIAAPLLLAGQIGCSPPPPPPAGPELDAGQIAARARTGTRLQEPARILFDWSLTERDGRFKGRGVARIEPPYRARLDLFLPGGESVARAALVDGDLRIPPGVPDGIIPPAHLLWGVLGVFNPGSGNALLGAQAIDGGGFVLRYGFPDGREIRYTLSGARVRGVEVLEAGHVVQRVELRADEDDRYPEEAIYRDLAAYRELTITRESVENVEPYPPDIWDPIR